MDPQTIKQSISQLNLPEELSQKANQIIDRSISADEMPEEDRQELADLLGIEADLKGVEAGAYEELGLSLTGMADEMTRATQVRDMNEKLLKEAAVSEAAKLETELNELSSGQDSVATTGLPGM